MMLVSKTETFVKLFFVLSIFGLIMYSVLAFYTFHTAFSSFNKSHRNRSKKLITTNNNDLKYILLWTVDQFSYNFTMTGQKMFFENKCEHTNCYLTTDKKLLKGDITKFDSIVFSIGTLRNWHRNMPQKRKMNQKFVFYSMVSADDNPVCHISADDFFNWTWSYKLYSDIVTPFIEVEDLTGKVVAPHWSVNWIKDVPATNNTIIKKRRAVMVFIDDCENEDLDHKGQIFVKKLQIYLEEHRLNLDIFGCKYKRCPERRCFQLLSTDYYFYLVYEPSFSEDYVTSKVLDAYDNDVVPIMVGGADYNRFLPPGSYINAIKMKPEVLASTIAYAIKTPSNYNAYFNWKRYYNIQESKLEKGYCDLCALLNNKMKMSVSSMYPAFRKWWYYGSLKEKCIPKGAEKFSQIYYYATENNITEILRL